jgi:hypothetical protein
MTKQRKRLQRQFETIERALPVLRRPLRGILQNRWRLVRVPLAFLLMAGSVFAILPIFGLWMFPLGLLLLAVDIPALQPFVSNALIRTRRRFSIWMAWFRRK